MFSTEQLHIGNP